MISSQNKFENIHFDEFESERNLKTSSVHWYHPSEGNYWTLAIGDKRYKQVQVNSLKNAGWAYAGIFDVAAWFQNQDQFWVPRKELHSSFLFIFS